MNDLKENELWKSSPKEEIDCAIFNLRKQILSQLTDLYLLLYLSTLIF